MSQQLDLRGRVALVTGAGVGLGRAIAIALGGANACVGLHYHRSQEGAAEVLQQLQSLPAPSDEPAPAAVKNSCPIPLPKGLLLPGDLTREDDANRIVDDLVARTGRLDILVNNAGALVGRASIEETSLDLWRQTLDANLTSAFMVTRRAIPHLRRAGGDGRAALVNIISLSTQTGGAHGAGAYAAAKGALQVFTRTLARELAPHVRVNAVCPGVIETRHHELATTPKRMAEYRQQTPLGRNGTAEDVAAAVLYLVSDMASFTTGALLDINGGRFLR